ncbi:MAG: multifunctional CCA addition/repair protein [Kangiella sp.]|nr:MAG: multifunctional CCA addition/repair protein [Kangiella sp.]
MQIFLVGGAVRDNILKYPVLDRDWVVVGSTSEQLLKLGYKQVGKDFPVFLHPDTGEEYALARTERKSGKGYKGFEVFAEQSVTLEEDLVRRDLTINAMATDSDGNFIDPFNGLDDLKNKILKHVSPAFSEDPLRVLRVARFLARYHHLGFSIAPSTKALMTELAQSGELKSLTPERIWTETVRALSEKSPHIYFQTLRDCGALVHLFPEIDCLWGVPNPARWHPEIDTGIHTMMVLEQSALLCEDEVTRFSALCHDLGKGITPKDQWPSHKGHEKAGVGIIEKLCKRIKVPKQYVDLAKIVSEFHLHLHKIEELKPKTIVKVLEKTDAFRKPERFKKFLLACEADFRGRTGFETRPYPQSGVMKQAFEVCIAISTKEIMDAGYQGKQIGERLHSERVRAVAMLFKNN